MIAPSLTEFLLTRIAEDEAEVAEWPHDGEWGLHPNGGMWVDPWGRPKYAPRSRVLAECEAKRRIIAWHESWPVMVETPPELDGLDDFNVSSMTLRMSQKIAWLTTQEYRARFGDEPPSSPMLRALAAVYANHPDYDEAWRP